MKTKIKQIIISYCINIARGRFTRACLLHHLRARLASNVGMLFLFLFSLSCQNMFPTHRRLDLHAQQPSILHQIIRFVRIIVITVDIIPLIL